MYNSQSPALAASQGFADKYLQAMMFRHRMYQDKIDRQYRQSVLDLRSRELTESRTYREATLTDRQRRTDIYEDRARQAGKPTLSKPLTAFRSAQGAVKAGADPSAMWELFQQETGGQYSDATTAFAPRSPAEIFKQPPREKSVHEQLFDYIPLERRGAAAERTFFGEPDKPRTTTQTEQVDDSIMEFLENKQSQLGGMTKGVSPMGIETDILDPDWQPTKAQIEQFKTEYLSGAGITGFDLIELGKRFEMLTNQMYGKEQITGDKPTAEELREQNTREAYKIGRELGYW